MVHTGNVNGIEILSYNSKDRWSKILSCNSQGRWSKNAKILSALFVNDPLVDRDHFVKADAFVDGRKGGRRKKERKRE